MAETLADLLLSGSKPPERETIHGPHGDGDSYEVEYVKPPELPAGLRLGWPGVARKGAQELGKVVEAQRLMDIQKARTAAEGGRIDMPGYMRKEFFSSLSPKDKMHYMMSWAPRGAPDTPLASPGFWALAATMSAPWAALGYNSRPVQDLIHGTPQQRRAREGVPVLKDQPY